MSSANSAGSIDNKKNNFANMADDEREVFVWRESYEQKILAYGGSELEKYRDAVRSKAKPGKQYTEAEVDASATKMFEYDCKTKFDLDGCSALALMLLKLDNLTPLDTSRVIDLFRFALENGSDYALYKYYLLTLEKYKEENCLSMSAMTFEKY